MEIGIYSFADMKPGGDPGQRLRDLLEEIELADAVGLDVFGVGEHHRPEYASSSPSTVLAAAAARTRRIRLTSAVTVLSSDDPIRVFQQFATIDQLSMGRAEIMAGRGSFIESFPLFGYDLEDYDSLFAEKLELLLRVRESERLTWEGGKHTKPVHDRGVYPRPYQHPLPVWIAVGGSTNSVARTAVLGLPLALAIIGGQPARFAPLIDFYRKVGEQAGHALAQLRVGINSQGYVAEDSRQAADDFFPGWFEVMSQIGRERGWGPLSRNEYEASRTLHGALFVGTPEEVAEKILYQHRLFNHDRFLLQLPVGPMPHEKVLRAIELLGTRVAPIVREEVARKQAAATETPAR